MSGGWRIAVRVLDLLIAGWLAVSAGDCIGNGVRHMFYGPSPGPGVILAAFGGLLAWMAYLIARGPRAPRAPREGQR